MTENTGNPTEPRLLKDAELDGVSGGCAWNRYEENDYRRDFEQAVRAHHLPANADFEDYMRSRGVTEDQLKCRAYWISKGSPWDMICIMESDGTFRIC